MLNASILWAGIEIAGVVLEAANDLLSNRREKCLVAPEHSTVYAASKPLVSLVGKREYSITKWQQ